MVLGYVALGLLVLAIVIGTLMNYINPGKVYTGTTEDGTPVYSPFKNLNTMSKVMYVTSMILLFVVPALVIMIVMNMDENEQKVNSSDLQKPIYDNLPDASQGQNQTDNKYLLTNTPLF